MKIVWGGDSNPEENKAMARWAAAIIWPDGRQFGECTTMGVFNGTEVVGVMVFHNYDPVAATIEYSGASTSPRWQTARTNAAMFDYMFNQIGCQMVVTRNSEHNKRLHRQLLNYGHRPHFIERLRGRDEGEIVWTLTKERWEANGFHKGEC